MIARAESIRMTRNALRADEPVVASAMSHAHTVTRPKTARRAGARFWLAVKP